MPTVYVRYGDDDISAPVEFYPASTYAQLDGIDHAVRCEVCGIPLVTPGMAEVEPFTYAHECGVAWCMTCTMSAVADGSLILVGEAVAIALATDTDGRHAA